MCDGPSNFGYQPFETSRSLKVDQDLNIRLATQIGLSILGLQPFETSRNIKVAWAMKPRLATTRNRQRPQGRLCSHSTASKPVETLENSKQVGLVNFGNLLKPVEYSREAENYNLGYQPVETSRCLVVGWALKISLATILTQQKPHAWLGCLALTRNPSKSIQISMFVSNQTLASNHSKEGET